MENPNSSSVKLMPTRNYDYLTVSSFPDVCRVCLAKKDVLKPLNEVSFTHNLNINGFPECIHLTNAVKLFCNITFSSLDQKPQSICENCIDMAAKAYGFFQLCTFSDIVLEKKLEEKKAMHVKENILPEFYTIEEYIEDCNMDSTEDVKSFPIVKDAPTHTLKDVPFFVIPKIEEVVAAAVPLILKDHNYSQMDKLKTKPNVKYRPPKEEKPRIRIRSKKPPEPKPEMETLRCQLCKTIEFQAVEEVLKHINENHSTHFKCIMCNLSLKGRELRKFHISCHFPDKFPCKPCQIIFNSPEELKTHETSKEHMYRKMCHICGKVFKMVHLKIRHIRTVHNKDSNKNNEDLSLKCDEVMFEDDGETITEIKTEDVQNLCEEKPVKKKTQQKPTVKPVMTKKFAYENNIFMCGICLDKSFNSLNAMLEHVREEHNSIEHCVICRSILKSPERRRFHYASHSAKSIVCRPCRQVFESVEELEQHKLTLEHNDKKVCTICNKRFGSKRSMVLHMKEIHFGGKNYQCMQCGSTFSRKGNLTFHEKRHKGDGSFLCPHCGKVLSSNFLMKMHIHRKHNIDMGMEEIIKSRRFRGQQRRGQLSMNQHKRYECKHCDMKFYTHPQYMRHCGIHPDFREFFCILCNVTFNSLNDYLEHEKTHPQYSCEECSRSFATISALHQHKRKHRALYKCDVCSHIAVSNGALAVHKRTHSGEKPHKCETCGKCFSHMGLLRCHTLSVHGTKPRECHICKKKFMYDSNLIAHLRTHTGVKPFPCPYCDKKFRDTVSRHKHVKSTHPECMEQFKIYKEQHQEEEVRKSQNMI